MTTENQILDTVKALQPFPKGWGVLVAVESEDAVALWGTASPVHTIHFIEALCEDFVAKGLADAVAHIIHSLALLLRDHLDEQAEKEEESVQ